MKSGLPKQFLPLCGKPVLLHSMQQFFSVLPGCKIILVLPEEHVETWKQCCSAIPTEIPHQITCGGPTRYHSVKNGLALASKDDIIAVHDGARPVVPRSLIERAFAEAALSGSAIPVVPVSESLRQISASANFPVDRNSFRIVQTPQVFRGDLLFRAYQYEYQPAFTDDATVVEQLGIGVTLIPGDPSNLKITHPTDLILAEAFLNAASI